MSGMPERIIIQGITRSGRTFRPSDWAERVCGVMSVFGADEQLRYSQHVRPMMMDGVRRVLLESRLAAIEPRAYRFMLDFARDNELSVIDPSNPSPDGDYCEIPMALG
jgi:hypothetical protein